MTRNKLSLLEIWRWLILMVLLVNATLALSACAGTQVTQTPNPLPTAIAPTSVHAASGSIQVSFKLDPRLSGPTYGGEVWVSPLTYGPIVQSGTTYLLEAKADLLNTKGQTTSISPEWTATDSEMVTISPNQGHEVKITIQHAGETTVLVTSQEISKTLTIKAQYQNDTIQVQISQ